MFQKANDTFAPLMVDGMMVPEEIDHLHTWSALEALQKAGKLKVGFRLSISDLKAF